MRLQKFEIEAIKKSFKKNFTSGHIYLFGSRVDDTQKGGDIDLYIRSEQESDKRIKKLHFLIDVKSMIGDQKIDVVLSENAERFIEQEAIEKGICLI